VRDEAEDRDDAGGAQGIGGFQGTRPALPEQIAERAPNEKRREPPEVDAEEEPIALGMDGFELARGGFAILREDRPEIRQADAVPGGVFVEFERVGLHVPAEASFGLGVVLGHEALSGASAKEEKGGKQKEQAGGADSHRFVTALAQRDPDEPNSGAAEEESHPGARVIDDEAGGDDQVGDEPERAPFAAALKTILRQGEHDDAAEGEDVAGVIAIWEKSELAIERIPEGGANVAEIKEERDEREREDAERVKGEQFAAANGDAAREKIRSPKETAEHDAEFLEGEPRLRSEEGRQGRAEFFEFRAPLERGQNRCGEKCHGAENDQRDEGDEDWARQEVARGLRENDQARDEEDERLRPEKGGAAERRRQKGEAHDQEIHNNGHFSHPNKSSRTGRGLSL
jgi:hypothetical protein